MGKSLSPGMFQFKYAVAKFVQVTAKEQKISFFVVFLTFLQTNLNTRTLPLRQFGWFLAQSLIFY